jgi:hypothetical protein
MFHQANLRQADVPEVSVNGVNRKLSLIQIWTEIVLQEMTRLYVVSRTMTLGLHANNDSQHQLASDHQKA